MSHEYQIRYVDDYGEESVENFHDKSEAKARYVELCCELQDAANHEGIVYELEWLEVFDQHTFKPMVFR